MKITTRQFIHSDHPVTCRNCQNHFVGKICNKCGEKVFDEKQLSAKHFFHQIIDFFTHFENKVLKTLWLNIAHPGLVTKHNLEGIRVRYANPIQLYLVVSVLFFFTVTKLHVYDYTPTYGDQNYYGLSAYRLFRWAEPADVAVLNGIDKMQVKHFTETKKNMLANFDRVKDTLTGLYPVRVQTVPDTTYLNAGSLRLLWATKRKSFFSTRSTLPSQPIQKLSFS